MKSMSIYYPYLLFFTMVDNSLLRSTIAHDQLNDILERLKNIESENEKLKKENVRDISGYDYEFNKKKKFIVDVCDYCNINDKHQMLFSTYIKICTKLQKFFIFYYGEKHGFKISLRSRPSNCNTIDNFDINNCLPNDKHRLISEIKKTIEDNISVMNKQEIDTTYDFFLEMYDSIKK